MADRDQRAVSTVVGYVLALGMVMLLLTGLLFAATDHVGDRRSATIREELRVVGQLLAGDLTEADRLVAAGGTNTTMSLTHEFPDTVAGAPYTIALQPGTPATVVLSTTDPAVSVDVQVRLRTAVTGSATTGGRVRVRYDGGGLEVRDG